MQPTGFHMGRVMWDDANQESMTARMRRAGDAPWEQCFPVDGIHQADVDVVSEFAPANAPLGCGSYGEVRTCAKHPELVVKELYDAPKRKWMRLMMHVMYGPKVALRFAPGEPWSFHSLSEYQAVATTLKRLEHVPGYAHVHPIAHFSAEGPYLYTPLCKGDVSTLPACYFESETPTWTCLAKHMCSAVTYMHACDVCHMDIKPANILYTRQQERFCFYLSDFDLVIPNELVYGARGTATFKCIPWKNNWLPGVYAEDTDKFALCKTLTMLLNTAGPLQCHMREVLQKFEEPTRKQYLDCYEEVHEYVRDAFAKVLDTLQLPSLSDVRTQRKYATCYYDGEDKVPKKLCEGGDKRMNRASRVDDEPASKRVAQPQPTIIAQPILDPTQLVVDQLVVVDDKAQLVVVDDKPTDNFWSLLRSFWR